MIMFINFLDISVIWNVLKHFCGFFHITVHVRICTLFVMVDFTLLNILHKGGGCWTKELSEIRLARFLLLNILIGDIIILSIKIIIIIRGGAPTDSSLESTATPDASPPRAQRINRLLSPLPRWKVWRLLWCCHVMWWGQIERTNWLPSPFPKWSISAQLTPKVKRALYWKWTGGQKPPILYLGVSGYNSLHYMWTTPIVKHW